MASRWSIAEQVIDLLNSGKGKSAQWADEREVYAYIGQALNSLLKLDYFKTTLDTGDTTPDGLALATYESIPVQGGYHNTAKLTLPANYIRLPHGLGVYYIGPQSPVAPSNILTAQFIPVPMGHGALVAGQPLLNGLFGQIGYEVHGLDVIFTLDITQPPNSITNCLVKLVVMDMNHYGDYDILPIPADMEAQCVQQAYQLFMTEKGPNKINDPISVLKPQQP